jgi:tetratricopeptide (TPR) repeat protein
MKNFLFSLLFVSSAILSYGQAALKLPALSPNAKIYQEFSTSNIEINYSRPSMRGRKIFGDVVAYNKLWRTGANSATKIKLGEELEIAGHKIKAGEYALYTIPNKESWEVIINMGANNAGIDGYSRDQDVARFKIRPITLDETCQTFTINITDITLNTCKIELVWERTKIVLPVVAHNNERIEKNISDVMNHSTKPYFQAANYYFETSTKIDLAKAYVDSAVEQNPKAFYMWYLKARIEKKLGNKDEAIAAAKKSIETAAGTANEAEYVHNNQKLIDEVKRSYRHRQED